MGNSWDLIWPEGREEHSKDLHAGSFDMGKQETSHTYKLWVNVCQP